MEKTRNTRQEPLSPEENEETMPEMENGADESEGQAEQAEEPAPDFQDMYVRLAAETQNYKKRAARELSEYKKYANEKIIKDLLPVIDNLERAIESAKTAGKDAAKLLEGVDLTAKELLKVLEKYGVQCVNAHKCEFDPNVHQALMTRESGDHPANTVIEQMQKGYLLEDRLLRPSLVVVSTEPQGNGE